MSAEGLLSWVLVWLLSLLIAFRLLETLETVVMAKVFHFWSYFRKE